VDLQERHQLDLASQVAGVKARARPWRAIIFTVLAVVAAGISYAFGRDLKNLFEPGHLTDSIAAAAAAAAFLIFGTLAVVSLASQARQTLQSVTGSAHAAVVRYAIVLIGAILTIAITLGLLKVPVGQLLVGGALATIIITIAGQQSLSNIFAGLVLLLSRPFQVGDVILLRSGALGGQLEGTVTEIGITYLRLDTGNDVMSLPNSQVLAAAVSRQPPAPEPGGPEQDGHGRRLPLEEPRGEARGPDRDHRQASHAAVFVSSVGRREAECHAGGGDALLFAGQQGQCAGIRLGRAVQVHRAGPQPGITDGRDLGRIHQRLADQVEQCEHARNGGKTAVDGPCLGDQPGQQRRSDVEHHRHHHSTEEGTRPDGPERRRPHQQQPGAQQQHRGGDQCRPEDGCRPCHSGLAGQCGGHHGERTDRQSPK